MSDTVSECHCTCQTCLLPSSCQIPPWPWPPKHSIHPPRPTPILSVEAQKLPSPHSLPSLPYIRYICHTCHVFLFSWIISTIRCSTLTRDQKYPIPIAITIPLIAPKLFFFDALISLVSSLISHSGVGGPLLQTSVSSRLAPFHVNVWLIVIWSWSFVFYHWSTHPWQG